MHKKAAFGIALVMLVSPVVASAQSADTGSLIARLTAMVEQLEQQLAALLSARGIPAPATVTPSAQPVPAAARLPSWCAQFATLKRGDTDTTTNGAVSELQGYLGITPASGYYGAQTGIGYQNRCGNLGNTQPTSVVGMSEYKTADFTFWYPSTWNVSTQSGSGVLSNITVRDSSGTSVMTVEELEPANGTLFSTIQQRGFETYYYDTRTSSWTHGVRLDGQSTVTAADMSQITMGGLHMFYLSQGLMYGDVVPLSATRFVRVSDPSLTHDVRPLVRTLVATNLNVATPVSTAQQSATVQAEAAAYGQGAAPGAEGTYVSDAYGVRLMYDPTLLSTAAPAVGSYMGSATLPNSFFSLYFTGGQAINGFDGASLVLAANSATNYEDCTRAQNSTTQVTINGRTFYRDVTGDAATGHYSSTYTYRTYYNGRCYEAAYQVNSYRTDSGQPGDISPVEQAMRNVVNSIVFTAAETEPVVHASTAPQWKTLAATKTPVSFTYPGSFSVYESENETDVGPAQLVGLQQFQSTISPGSISIQMTPSKYFPAGDTAAQAMQASMKTEPIGSGAYTLGTLGGEAAYARGATGANGFSVIYVAHGNNYFRILLMAPLLTQEYQNFIGSFYFTN